MVLIIELLLLTGAAITRKENVRARIAIRNETMIIFPRSILLPKYIIPIKIDVIVKLKYALLEKEKRK